jgi:hypothetical protein
MKYLRELTSNFFNNSSVSTKLIKMFPTRKMYVFGAAWIEREYWYSKKFKHQVLQSSCTNITAMYSA